MFRRCSVATNLVTSLELQPICCATTLCNFGQTRKGYVATHFHLLSSTAESSATSGYVVSPERFGQNEEQDSRNDKRARKKPSFVPSSGFNRCNMKTHVNITLSVIYIYFILRILFSFGAFLK